MILFVGEQDKGWFIPEATEKKNANTPALSAALKNCQDQFFKALILP